MDDFNTLSNRLLNRCPAAGIILSQQFVNDAWQTMQARREWSFRRRGSTFAPPDLYNTGSASTNVGSGQPTLVTGTGTNWTANMIGRQIRIGGLLYPFYTITGWVDATNIYLDAPWAGPDVVNQSYSILQCYFPVPNDFGYFYSVVSVKDGYRLWTTVTEAEINMMDPQRTNFGQTYAVAFKDYTPQFMGTFGPAFPVNTLNLAPQVTTQTGYTLPYPATYIIQIVGAGVTGTATYTWSRISASGVLAGADFTTDTNPIDLSDGLQLYWPASGVYTVGDCFAITAQPVLSSGVPRYELWPAPTYSAYLYPYMYIAKEAALTVQQPQLPPFVANRGEVLLEMAMQKCAEYPGADADHVNIYHDLKQAIYHARKVDAMLVDLERNDEEVGVTNIDYQMYPLYPAPWLDGQWEQRHAPYLNG